MRRVLVWVLGLGVVFEVLATLIAPSVLGWYFTPPQGGVVMMKGDDAVRWGMNRLIETQSIAFIIGAILGLVIGLKLRPKTVTPGELPLSSKTPTTPTPVGPGGCTPTSV